MQLHFPQPIGYRRQLQWNGGHGRLRAVLSQCDGLRGNVVGTWNVTSSCLGLSSSNLDIGAAGLNPSACNNVTLSGSLTVTGTWTANANGTYTDGTTTTGNVAVGNAGRVLESFGDQITCDGINATACGMGLATAIAHRRGRRVHVHGHGPADGRDRVADRGSAKKRQLHHGGQRPHR